MLWNRNVYLSLRMIRGILLENTGEKEVEFPSTREAFSFGAGDWLEGPDADEEQKNINGRWLAFKVVGATRGVPTA
jgi:hypothetical protein